MYIKCLKLLSAKWKLCFDAQMVWWSVTNINPLWPKSTQVRWHTSKCLESLDPLLNFKVFARTCHVATVVKKKQKKTPGILWICLSPETILKLLSFFPHHFFSGFLSKSAGVSNPFMVGVVLSISHVGSWTKLSYLPLCCPACQETPPGIQVGCGAWGPGDCNAKSWSGSSTFQYPWTPGIHGWMFSPWCSRPTVWWRSCGNANHGMHLASYLLSHLTLVFYPFSALALFQLKRL